MAGEQESQAQGSSGGQAAGALTPPSSAAGVPVEQTMKFSSADQNTIQTAPKTMQQHPSNVPQSATHSPVPKGSHNTIANELGPQTLALGLALQDLASERLLLSAPRTESHGRQCPTLNGIPLLAKLGQGGMGAVYYGIHPRLRSEVAVKVLPFHLAEQDPGMVRRFFREAQIAAQVRSPHLVNVMDVNEEAGLFFLVMEFVSGMTAGQYLKQLIEKGAQGYSELEALDLTIAATEGLWAAHANNIVHRDIKPDNIMIPYQTRTAKDLDLPRAKLMDLGLARSEDSQQSLTGAQAAMGTPGYMAPEQAMDAKSADKRSDVFSMGAAIYALLSGRAPFKGETIMKVLMATMHEPHEPLIKMRADVSPAVNEVVEKCLTKKQDHRFQDARQLLGALQDCRRLLTGGGPAGALSAARTFVYPQTGPAPAGGPGSSAAVAGAAGVSQTPVPGTTTMAGGAAAASKPKGMIYAGVAAGVLLLALGGLYLGKRPAGKVEPGPGAGPDTNQPGKTDTASPEEIAKFTKRHTKLINEAKANIEGGDPDEAKIFLDLAKTLDLKEPAAKAKEAEIEKAIAQFGNTQKYKKILVDVEKLVKQGDLKTAKEKLTNKDTVKLAPDDPKITQQAEGLEKQITDKLREVSKRESNGKRLADARSLLKDGKADEALGKVEEVLAAFADPKDELNKDATGLKGLIAVAQAEQQKKSDYDKLIKDATADFTAEKYDKALDKTLSAQTIFPTGKEAADLVAKINPKLDETKRKQAAEAARQQREKKLSDALAAARTQLNAGKLDEANASVKTALEVDAQNAGALALQKLVLDATDKSRLADELQKRSKTFESLLTEAGLMTEYGEVDTATQKLADAKKLFPDDQDKLALLQSAEKKVAEKREAQKVTAEYDGLLTKAKEARRAAKLDPAKLDTAKLDEAAQHVQKALACKVADLTKAQNLKKQIEDDLAEQQGKVQQAAAAKDAEYAGFMTKGDSLEKAGDAKGDAFDERIAQYKLALAQYGSAKAVKSGGPAEQKETGLKAKIAEAEAAKKKKDEAAGLTAKKRQDFDAKVALADAAIRKNDFDGAQQQLDAAKLLAPDDAAGKILDAKVKELGELRGQDKAIRGAFGEALAALKKSPLDLSAAMAPVQKACQDYPKRADMAAVRSNLKALQDADAQIKQSAAAASAKYADYSKVKKLAGTKELDQYAAARDRLLGITTTAAAKLATSNFADAAAVLQSLDGEQQQIGREIADLTQRLDKAAKEEDKKPVQRAGELDPFDDGGKKPKEAPKPEPKKKKGGSVGEQDVFD